MIKDVSWVRMIKILNLVTANFLEAPKLKESLEANFYLTVFCTVNRIWKWFIAYSFFYNFFYAPASNGSKKEI